jgi:transposase
MNAPKRIELNIKELEALLQRVANGSLQDGDYEIIKGMADTIVFLDQAVNDKTTSIKRLLRMLFGDKTEKAKNILKNLDEKNSETADKSSDDDNEKNSGKNPKHQPKKKKRKKKPKGHGRKKAEAYIGADKKFISHPELKHGEPCPSCEKGKVYEQATPGVLVRITGNAPLQGTIYELQKLRCNLCGEIFTAEIPDQSTNQKYDETARAIIPLLKYGSGIPFYRLEKLQESLGIPLSASTQWDKVEEAADRIYPVFEEIKRQAAQGDLVYNDDTTMKILDLIKDNKQKSKDERKGIFTSGILSKVGERTIALFFTGREHAGENLSSVLAKRDADKDPPIQMCDALSRNESKDFKSIMANCMVHARRNYVDVISNFPDECGYVIELLGEVYGNDAITKEQKMSPEERLQFHQAQSGPLMDNLYNWLNKQIDEKLVEPNSGLGGPILYMLKHWTKLTCFLKVPGAPLDNNLCEQALKRAILHRKNSLFYKTEHGAYIGDMFMSLIHTCNLMKINAFEYLIALQKHSSDLFKNPSRWMPWNFEDTITSLISA